MNRLASVFPGRLVSLSAITGRPALRYAFLIYITARIALSLWAIAVLTINPLPEQPRETHRPYLGEPILRDGPAGLLLGPWQRFDTMHYLRVARQGCADVADSV